MADAQPREMMEIKRQPSPKLSHGVNTCAPCHEKQLLIDRLTEENLRLKQQLRYRAPLGGRRTIRLFDAVIKEAV
jgi:dynactin complex subunit